MAKLPNLMRTYNSTYDFSISAAAARLGQPDNQPVGTLAGIVTGFTDPRFTSTFTDLPGGNGSRNRIRTGIEPVTASLTFQSLVTPLFDFYGRPVTDGADAFDEYPTFEVLMFADRGMDDTTDIVKCLFYTIAGEQTPYIENFNNDGVSTLSTDIDVVYAKIEWRNCVRHKVDSGEYKAGSIQVLPPGASAPSGARTYAGYTVSPTVPAVEYDELRGSLKFNGREQNGIVADGLIIDSATTGSTTTTPPGRTNGEPGG